MGRDQPAEPIGVGAERPVLLHGSGEGLAVCGYFALHLAWNFRAQESELQHWLTLVLVPLVLLAGLYWRNGRRPVIGTVLASVGLRRGNLRRGLVWAVVIGLGLSVVQVTLAARSEAVRELIVSGRALYLAPLAFVLLFLTAAFTEELFFRGVMQTRLTAMFRSNVVGILVTSVLFGLYHLPYAYLNPRWPSYGDFPAAVVAALGNGLPGGLILGVMYAASRRNLLACAVLHAMIDTLPAMTMIKIGGE